MSFEGGMCGARSARELNIARAPRRTGARLPGVRSEIIAGAKAAHTHSKRALPAKASGAAKPPAV